MEPRWNSTTIDSLDCVWHIINIIFIWEQGCTDQEAWLFIGYKHTWHRIDRAVDSGLQINIQVNIFVSWSVIVILCCDLQLVKCDIVRWCVCDVHGGAVEWYPWWVKRRSILEAHRICDGIIFCICKVVELVCASCEFCSIDSWQVSSISWSIIVDDSEIQLVLSCIKSIQCYRVY